MKNALSIVFIETVIFYSHVFVVTLQCAYHFHFSLIQALQLDPQHPLAVDNIREVEEFLRKEGMLSEENHPIQPHDGHRKFEDDTTDISLEEIEIVLSTVPISQVCLKMLLQFLSCIEF